ncbi:MAG: NAD(P)-dependent oxidoreductase [Pseudomonadota bacterium]
MNFAITGIAGFVGGTLARLLAPDGQVIGFYSTSLPHDCAAAHLRQASLENAAECAALDLTSLSAEVMIHCAAKLSKRDSGINVVAANAEMTLNGVEIAKRLGCRLFVNISSTAVYAGPDPDGTREDHAVPGIETYGRSKLVGEAIATYSAGSAMNVVSLRIPSPQGPGNPHRSMVPMMAKSAREQGFIRVLGDPRRRQSYLDLRELAEAVRRLSASPGPLRAAYNVASVASAGNMDVATSIARHCRTPCLVEDQRTEESAHPEAWNLICDAAATDFDFRPQYQLDDTVKWIMQATA